MTAPVTAVARFYDREPQAMFRRLRDGWPPERAVHTPTRRGYLEGHRRALEQRRSQNEAHAARWRQNHQRRRQAQQLLDPLAP